MTLGTHPVKKRLSANEADSLFLYSQAEADAFSARLHRTETLLPINAPPKSINRVLDPHLPPPTPVPTAPAFRLACLLAQPANGGAAIHAGHLQADSRYGTGGRARMF